jgi:nucleoside-diphosphate-sugar epimerase
MPTIPPAGTVLVSGSNGYIATWVVRTLLERGYRVRGTVRTEEKIKYMKEYFENLGYAYGQGGKLELVIVEDIVKVYSWTIYFCIVIDLAVGWIVGRRFRRSSQRC